MSVSIDPFVIPIPQQWLKDPEVAATVQYLWRYLYDLRERTGGDDDAIATLEDSALYDVGIKGAEIAEMLKQIEELRIQNDMLLGIIHGLQDSMSKQISSLEAQDNSLILLAEITELRKRIEAIENGYDP